MGAANAEAAVETEAVDEATNLNPNEEEETGGKEETELDAGATLNDETTKECQIVQPDEAGAQNEDLDDVFVNTASNTAEVQSEPAAELGAEVNESLIQENNIGHTTDENTCEDEEDQAVADVTDSNAQCSSVRGSVDESSVLDHGAELEEANNSFVEEDVADAGQEEQQEVV